MRGYELREVWVKRGSTVILNPSHSTLGNLNIRNLLSTRPFTVVDRLISLFCRSCQ